MKLLTAFGTQLEAIKMALLDTALESSGGFEQRVWLTAQHWKTLDQVLQLFDITPHHDRDLMRTGQTL